MTVAVVTRLVLELTFWLIQVAALPTVRVVDSFLFCLRKVQESLEDQIAKTVATQQWNIFAVVYLLTYLQLPWNARVMLRV